MLRIIQNLFCISEQSRFQRAVQAFFLGVCAPLGWLGITHVLQLTATDPLYEVTLYSYITVGSILVMVCFALWISKSEEYFARMSLLDPLTSLYNSRYLLTRADQEFAMFERAGQDIALVMADIDHFKYVNDRYGHSVGDIVLQQVAKIMQNTARKADVVARVGGEEFALLLPNSTTDGAMVLAERIRERVEKTPIDLPGGEKIGVKISLGVSSTEEFLPQVFNELYESADNALYRAKRDGRNRVVKAVETDPLTNEVAC
ncbi:GGDEF domain-containing protein [Halodesulfovibrio marinisediminis]|uniref:diguanylate cyclase n=1 Tax=Halodesulfovibrio marinisediminis DSM 17456 TaxID=1121457 RepID=A0A1N6G274_9BACT|nr:GGDEF domain-containing protein [Halodesulfovibrio marinisediminis]SIO01590.1 diguanylate cyclase (GGDEF) domain-containing protein [Halodesulfovibrio marinisediminis DSM 17456]